MQVDDLFRASRALAFNVLEPANAPLVTPFGLAELIKNAAAVEESDEPTAATLQNIWRRADASPVVLLALLLDRYGKDMLEWTAESLLETLRRDDVAVSNAVWTKILAVRPLLTSPAPWRRWDVFHWTALGLSGTSPNFELAEEPRLGHAVTAVNIMKIIDPQREFGDEVEKFIAAIFRLESVFYAPAPLSFAQDEIESPMLECSNCHARHRDDDDIRCITCGKTTLKREPFEFADLRDETKALWNGIKALPLDQAVEKLPHDNAGNAVYALATNYDYARDQTRAMRAQLRMLRDHL